MIGSKFKDFYKDLLHYKHDSFSSKVNNLRAKYISDNGYMIILCIFVGIISAFAAILLKNTVHFISLAKDIFPLDTNYSLFILPMIGIFLTVIVIKYLFKESLGEGVPKVLYAISRNNANIKKKGMFTSIIGSALTVGFGGSAGLEGPTIATGAAIGSNIGQYFKLSYHQKAIMIAVASSAALAAIFKSPIAGIVFVMEVLMLDLTVMSVIPLLVATVTATLISYLFLGTDVIYDITLTEKFQIGEFHLFIILGVIMGLVSASFTKIYKVCHVFFNEKLKKWGLRLLVGGISLGILIFFIPSFYGEGFDAINDCLHGNYQNIFSQSFFNHFGDSFWLIALFLLLSGLFKSLATSLTFGACGMGGTFAPTLFVGAHIGLLFALVVNHLGLYDLSLTNYALVGMAGGIAGVIHAPLTAIFLIAEITGGYSLFLPLMITSVFSYITVRVFQKNSVYTYLLAQSGDLLTHNTDKNALTMLNIKNLIEDNFKTVNINGTLRDLVNAISLSSRNIFPVVDQENNFFGYVRLDDIRDIIFKPELYDSIFIKDIMIKPQITVSLNESVESIAEKFHRCDKYNFAVIQDNKYIGFVSRANLLSEYRKKLKEFSDI